MASTVARPAPRRHRGAHRAPCASGSWCIDGAMGTAIQRDRPVRGRLPRRAVRRLAERPAGQQRPAHAHPARDHRRHPPRVPRGRRRHHRDQHVQRQRGLPRRLRHGGARLRAQPRGRPAGPREAADDGDAPRTGRGTSPARSARPPGPRRSRPTSTTRPRATCPSTSWSRRTPRPTRGLLDGGVDLLFIETIFDTLNAKAAIFAVETLFEEHGRRWPVIVSGTITDASGRTLSGQVTEAFWDSVRHVRPARRRPQLRARRQGDAALHRRDARGSPTRSSPATRTPGCPTRSASTTRRPRRPPRSSASSPRAGYVNLVGGCCGTTPAHIAAIAARRRGQAAPRRPSRARARPCACPASSRSRSPRTACSSTSGSGRTSPAPRGSAT